MILVIRNGKIIGIDKTLLKILDVDLQKISSVINKIELEIAALKNKHINLNNKTLKVVKKEMISIEDIEIFDVFPVDENHTSRINDEKTLQKSLELETVQPLEINQPEIAPIEQVNTLKTEEPKIVLEDIIDNYEQKENLTPEINELAEIQKETWPKIDFETAEPAPVKEPSLEISAESKLESQNNEQLNEFDIAHTNYSETSQEEKIPHVEKTPLEISISFEDEMSEVEKILELSDHEAKELIKNDLNQAKDELGINDEMANEFLRELYKQIENERSTFLKALKNGDYDAIHKTAHKLKGAALNLRLSKLAYILKIIDEKSKQGVSIETLKNLINKFYEFFSKISEIKTFTTSKSSIPKEIQQLIKQTLKEYLETQNEKKFKKDKKYIEKLLNKKIDSIEDLKIILKGTE